MRIATFATTASLALFGTIALAQTVNYDYDRAANFSRFKTYAWARGTELTDALNHGRVVRSIESQLGAKQRVRADSINGNGWNGCPAFLKRSLG